MEHDKELEGPEMHSRPADRRNEVKRSSPRGAPHGRVFRRRQDITPDVVVSAPASTRRVPAHRLPNDLLSPVASNVETSILIVDADKRAREMLVGSFVAFGFRCVEACDAERALEVIEKRCPGLGVLDIRLPGMSGGELAWRIRERDLLFPLVGLMDQVAADTWDADDLQDLGFDALFSKPVEHEDLLIYCGRAVLVRRIPVAHVLRFAAWHTRDIPLM